MTSLLFTHLISGLYGVFLRSSIQRQESTTRHYDRDSLDDSKTPLHSCLLLSSIFCSSYFADQKYNPAPSIYHQLLAFIIDYSDFSDCVIRFCAFLRTSTARALLESVRPSSSTIMKDSFVPTRRYAPSPTIEAMIYSRIWSHS
jgi:hypothetical protein